MKKRRILMAALCAVTALTICACGAEWDRTMKDISSNYGGGLSRTVTVYDMQGKPIKEYTGKIDVEDNEGKVLFDLDGKRTIIYNATVIAQEN